MRLHKKITVGNTDTFPDTWKAEFIKRATAVQKPSYQQGHFFP